MSMLSKFTGIGINPLKGKIKIDPLKAIGTALTVGTMGGFGPIAGLASKVGGSGLAGLAAKAGTALKAKGIGGLLKGGLDVAGGISGMVSSAKASKKEGEMLGNQHGIANSMNARGGAMADAASKGLLARLAAGPRATPDFGRFVDRANPFSGQFAPPPVAPTATARIAPPEPQAPPPTRTLPPPPAPTGLLANPLMRKLLPRAVA